MKRKRTTFPKKHHQLVTYLRFNYGYEYTFIREVVNREFDTDYTNMQLRGIVQKFSNSGRDLKTDLIPEWMPHYPPEPYTVEHLNA